MFVFFVHLLCGEIFHLNKAGCISKHQATQSHQFFFWVFSPDIVGIQLLFFLIWFVLVVIVDLQKLKNLKIQLIRYLLFSE